MKWKESASAAHLLRITGRVSSRDWTALLEQERTELDCADQLTDILPLVSPSLEGRWQAIETFSGKHDEYLFWVVSKPADEAYVDTSGNPIFSMAPPRLVKGKYGQWSSLDKATHWQPLPPAPRPSAEPDEKATEGLARREKRDSAIVQPPQPPTGEK